MTKKFNDGTVITNDKCIGCNKCIFVCPVNGANVTVKGDNKVKVVSKKCISCGNCIKNCNRNAREYSDDIGAFFESLQNGKKISLLVDSDFWYSYGPKAMEILVYLKSLGVDKIYDVAFGGDISIWAHMHYLIVNHDNPDRAFIGHTCSSAVNYFEQERPEYLSRVIPVQTSLMCTAIYVRKYLRDTNTLAYISPCISAKDEMQEEGNRGLIEYNLTIGHLMDYLSDYCSAENLEVLPKVEYDLLGRFLGRLLPLKGSLCDCMAILFQKKEQFSRYDTLDESVLKALTELIHETKSMPLLTEVTSCKKGCLFGSGIDTKWNGSFDSIDAAKKVKEDIFANFDEMKDYLEIREYLDGLMSGIRVEDFYCEYEDKFQQTGHVPDIVIEEIFNKMHKDTPEKREMDCSACGYSTCRDMAKAVASGYSMMDNCIHYLNDELTIRYYTDKLTGLPNKEGFKKNVEQLFRDNPDKQYMIGILNINQLNVINDLYGFAIGDQLIVHVAIVCDSFVGENGVVGRLSGGEFLLCFERTEEKMQMLKNVSLSEILTGGVSFPFSFRMGVYDDSDKKETLETMINLATLTRDRIEETGANVILFYNDEIRNKLARETEITAKMHYALENKEFVAYFQPQYNHRTGKMIGAETLCRWIEPDGTMISPGEFIPIFEKNGFIKQLDKYMWEQVFIHVSKWIEEGINIVPISVNVSRLSVTETDFIETIRVLSEKYNVDRDLIHFEITESAYTRHQSRLINMVDMVREMGYKVAMDDFGSGYSSLNTLKNVPIDILKLDMGFLSEDNETKGEKIIKNVVTMASELDLDMISEGVETKEQADFLMYVGCDVIQGFYYSKPIPVAEFEKKLKEV